MKIKEWYNNKLASFEKDFDFRLEKLILSITESISKRMEVKNINRKKLSELLDVSPPAVTKILNGTSNFTLKTLLSLADALELKLNIDFEDTENMDTVSAWPSSKSSSYETWRKFCIAYYDDSEIKNKDKPIILTTTDDVPQELSETMPLRNAA